MTTASFYKNLYSLSLISIMMSTAIPCHAQSTNSSLAHNKKNMMDIVKFIIGKSRLYVTKMDVERTFGIKLLQIQEIPNNYIRYMSVDDVNKDVNIFLISYSINAVSPGKPASALLINWREPNIHHNCEYAEDFKKFLENKKWKAGPYIHVQEYQMSFINNNGAQISISTPGNPSCLSRISIMSPKD